MLLTCFLTHIHHNIIMPSKREYTTPSSKFPYNDVNLRWWPIENCFHEDNPTSLIIDANTFFDWKRQKVVVRTDGATNIHDGKLNVYLHKIHGFTRARHQDMPSLAKICGSTKVKSTRNYRTALNDFTLAAFDNIRAPDTQLSEPIFNTMNSFTGFNECANIINAFLTNNIKIPYVVNSATYQRQSHDIPDIIHYTFDLTFKVNKKAFNCFIDIYINMSGMSMELVIENILFGITTKNLTNIHKLLSNISDTIYPNCSATFDNLTLEQKHSLETLAASFTN